MQFVRVICCSLLPICVTAMFMNPENHDIFMANEEDIVTQINRRDTHVMLIDNISRDEDPPAYKTPMVMYRRRAKKKLRPPTPKYYQPTLANNRLMGSTKRPLKKYSRNRIRPQYTAPLSELHPNPRQKKVKHGRPQSPASSSLSKHHKRPPAHKELEPAGFGEPPKEYKTQKKSFNKNPPLDYDPMTDPYRHLSVSSYDTSVKSVKHDDYGDYHDSNIAATTVMQGSKKYAGYDMDGALPYSKQFFSQPEGMKDDFYDDQTFGTFNRHANNYPRSVDPFYMQKQKNFYSSNNHKMSLNKPWKATGTDQVVVGGQYAEPPARVVSKFQPSAPMLVEDSDSLVHGGNELFDTEHTQISPYVNYKNSNIAFSPQNLNDAFSI